MKDKKPYKRFINADRDCKCTDCGLDIFKNTSVYYSGKDKLGFNEYHCALPCESLRRNLDGTVLR